MRKQWINEHHGKEGVRVWEAAGEEGGAEEIRLNTFYCPEAVVTVTTVTVLAGLAGEIIGSYIGRDVQSEFSSSFVGLWRLRDTKEP
ncbi:hypothetical protein CHUAL_003731 [Chamberlinius hualienensis]